MQIAVIAWIAVIFFSSTSVAARWCEELYRFLSSVLFRPWAAVESFAPWLHVAAAKSVHITLFSILGSCCGKLHFGVAVSEVLPSFLEVCSLVHVASSCNRSFPIGTPPFAM